MSDDSPTPRTSEDEEKKMEQDPDSKCIYTAPDLRWDVMLTQLMHWMRVDPCWGIQTSMEEKNLNEKTEHCPMFVIKYISYLYNWHTTLINETKIGVESQIMFILLNIEFILMFKISVWLKL